MKLLGKIDSACYVADGWPVSRAVRLASLRQGETQDGLPLRGFRLS